MKGPRPVARAKKTKILRPVTMKKIYPERSVKEDLSSDKEVEKFRFFTE